MVHRAYLLLVNGLAALAGVLIVALMLIVSAEVIGRFGFNRPIGWATEASEYILLHIPFLAMAWLVRQRGGHVSIDLVTNQLPPRRRAAVNALAAAAVAVICALCGYWAGVTTIDHYERRILTIGIYPVPKYQLLIVIVVGFALTMIEFARVAFHELQGVRHGGASPDDAHPVP